MQNIVFDAQQADVPFEVSAVSNEAGESALVIAAKPAEAEQPEEINWVFTPETIQAAAAEGVKAVIAQRAEISVTLDGAQLEAVSGQGARITIRQVAAEQLPEDVRQDVLTSAFAVTVSGLADGEQVHVAFPLTEGMSAAVAAMAAGTQEVLYPETTITQGEDGQRTASAMVANGAICWLVRR